MKTILLELSIRMNRVVRKLRHSFPWGKHTSSHAFSDDELAKLLSSRSERSKLDDALFSESNVFDAAAPQKDRKESAWESALPDIFEDPELKTQDDDEDFFDSFFRDL